MKFSVAFFAALAAAQCSNPIVRQNWDDLSSSDKQSYVAALKALGDRPQSGGIDPTQMSLGDFTNIHVTSSPYVHDAAVFYPYHRGMMWKFEQALASVRWSKGLVYWDWFQHSSDWSTTDVFTKDYFGAVTSDDPDHCVKDGHFAKGAYNVANLKVPTYRPFPNPSDTCLRRCGGGVLTALNDGTLDSRFGALSYAQFRGDTQANDDQNGFHSSGHETMGGDGGQCDMANGSSSPNDPVFYLHHGLVDKVWYLWQSRCAAFKKDYEGPSGRDPATTPGNDNAVDSTQVMPDWNIPVSQVLDTQGGTLCYTYSASAIDKLLASLPAVQCPSGPTTPAPTTQTPLVDAWLGPVLSDMILQKGFGFGGTNKDSVIARRDDGSPTADFTVTQDGSSIVVTWKGFDGAVYIPGDETVRYVYNSYVETYGPDGSIHKYHMPMDGVTYPEVPGAPQNVQPGHPCFQAYPTPMSDGWIAMHQLNEVRVRNGEAKSRYNIDVYNVENCASYLTSNPSS